MPGAQDLFGRRQLLGTLSLGVFACARAAEPASPLSDDVSDDVAKRLAELERRSGGRLGVAALQLKTGRRVGHREHERFPMCSTFKLPLVAAVLQRVDAGRESLSRFVAYDSSALLEYAPVTREHLPQGGMTVEGLCAASLTLSDNTAANLLLETLGGPPGLTAFFRALGDDVSRLDRTEPLLNTALPGDERDTTSPRAMLEGLRKALLEPSTLTEPSRLRLLGWLEQASTGRNRLRAGLPQGWRAGDKTGTGENGVTNDVAIAWSPSGAPLLITAYTAGSSQSDEERAATLAQVARLVTQ